MADTPQDAETAAREALVVTAAETLRLYGEFGTNRSREIEQSEAAARAILALRPASSPGEVTVTEAMVEAARVAFNRCALGPAAIDLTDILRAALTAALLSTTQTEG